MFQQCLKQSTVLRCVVQQHSTSVPKIYVGMNPNLQIVFYGTFIVLYFLHYYCPVETFCFADLFDFADLTDPAERALDPDFWDFLLFFAEAGDSAGVLSSLELTGRSSFVLYAL